MSVMKKEDFLKHIDRVVPDGQLVAYVLFTEKDVKNFADENEFGLRTRNGNVYPAEVLEKMNMDILVGYGWDVMEAAIFSKRKS